MAAEKGKGKGDAGKGGGGKGGAVKDQQEKTAVQKDPKEFAKEVLAELLRLTKSGKLPKEIYDIVSKYAGKAYAKEKEALAFMTIICTNMVQLKTQSADVDQKEVEKVLRGFAARRDSHGLYGKQKPWSDYLNDPTHIWMFDNDKVWALYVGDKLK